MRLILMGTGPFAVPTFNALASSRHDVVAVVTRSVPPALGRRKGPANPVRDLFAARDIPLLSPENANDSAFCRKLGELGPELLVVSDFGQILSREMLAVACYGGINLHGSLLPKYRGAAPINWALWNGDTETGVTVIHMTPRLDAGPNLTMARTPIVPDEDAVQLEGRLAQLGIEPVMQAIDLLAQWDGKSPIGQMQDPAQATKAPRLNKSDGQVDWSQPARRIYNQVRALQPWPGTYTQWLRAKGPLRLILDQVSVITDPPPCPSSSAGQVVQSEGDELWIAAGKGALAIRQVHPAGKRAMSVREFLRGYPVQVGDQFGD